MKIWEKSGFGVWRGLGVDFYCKYYLKGYALCRRPLLASRVAIWGARCRHFDILGDHFSTSGAPWGAILVPRGHRGGPWEQQDGLEMVVYRIFFDFGVILGPVYISFLSSKTSKFHVFSGLFASHFFIDSETKFLRLRPPNQGFRIETIAKSFFYGHIFNGCRSRFLCFLEGFGTEFLVFWALKTRLKIEGFL